MKTIAMISVLIFGLSAIQIVAQVPALQKGSFLVGGSTDLSFLNHKMETSYQSGGYSSKSSISSVSLSPQIGYFLAEGFVIGGLLNFTRSAESDDDYNSISSEFSIGPFLRYYSRSKIFFHGEYSLGNQKEKFTGQSQVKNSLKLSAWKFGAGYAAFLNESIALEPHVMYSVNTLKFNADEYELKSSVGRFTIGLNFTMFIAR